MKNGVRLLYATLLGGLALGLTSCPGPNQPAGTAPGPPPSPAVPATTSPLPTVAHQLGKTDFHLTLPPGFALRAVEGPDFLVYYFAPADTTVRADFTGGLYLGANPQSEETATPAGCRTRRATVVLLGHPAALDIRRCATGYTLNGVFASHSGRRWDAQVNAFGEAQSAAGLRQLLAVLATLRRQPQPAPRQ